VSAELEWNDSIRLVDILLEQQQTLSAVDEFSAYHEAAGHDAGRYEALIPSGLPGAAEQYAFRVDIDTCTGCKACVTACHSLNGLDTDEAWRQVGLVESDPEALLRLDAPSTPPHQQTVTTACHHCEEPACLAGCPVRAYEKDPTTGIVRHLDDQCIGCRYCELMCPYDVPSYSKRLGVVRKCDMCHERLAEGEAPACVQGCPNEAISIGIALTGKAGGGRGGDRLLRVSPGAMPESSWTRPTTQYVSTRSVSAAVEPVDLGAVQPSAGHGPLAVMLVLTQVAIGAVVVDALLAFGGSRFGGDAVSSAIVSTLATIIGLAGLGASFLHLGRPQWAFRAFLGLRSSWMSREIVVLGAFAGLLVGACLLSWIDWNVASGGLDGFWQKLAEARPVVRALAAAVGLSGLLCSVEIYAVTGRPLWRFDRTALRFSSTAAWAGLATAQVGLALSATPALSARATQIALALLLVGLSLARLRMESGRMVESSDPFEAIALARTRHLLEGVLRPESRLRRRSLVVSGVVLPAGQISLVLVGASPVIQAGLAACVLLIGLASDLLERSLFFRAEAMPSMPGGLDHGDGIAAQGQTDCKGLAQPRWTPDSGTRTHTRSLRSRSGPGESGPRFGHASGLWLLRDRMWTQGAYARWGGAQSFARSRLSRESRHGLPEGLGSAGSARCVRPRYAPDRAR